MICFGLKGVVPHGRSGDSQLGASGLGCSVWALMRAGSGGWRSRFLRLCVTVRSGMLVNFYSLLLSASLFLCGMKSGNEYGLQIF